MKLISTRIHGYLDYGLGILLVALPGIKNYSHGATESIILYACGVAMLVMALITRYELALFRILPMTAHLTADIIIGAFIAVAPVAFEFSQRVFLPYTILGLCVIISSFYTSRVVGPVAGRTAE